MINKFHIFLIFILYACAPVSLNTPYIDVDETIKLKFGMEYLSQEDQRKRYENLMGDLGLMTFSQLEYFQNFGTYILSNLEYESGVHYNLDSFSSIQQSSTKFGANNTFQNSKTFFS